MYLRVSVEDGDKRESDSIEGQRKIVKGFIQSNPELVLKQEYVDDGYTGTNFDRPDFKNLLNDIENGKINCVIVKDLSRFGRNHIDVEIYINRYFKDHGIRFIAVNDHYDTLEKGYDMMFSIHNLFNEHYARDISNKCQSAFKAKQRAGEFVGAFASYGYRKSDKDRHVLEIDPYAAEIVKRIFRLYIEGHGIIRIAIILNDEDILCPAEYKKQNGLNYRNCNRLETTHYWTYSTVRNILKNEMYIGNMVQGKACREMHGKPYLLNRDEWVVVQGTHPAIIDTDTWNKTQRLLEEKTQSIDFTSNQSIFAGFVKCGDCGRALAKKNHKDSKGKRYSKFYCGTYVRNGKKYCSPHSIRESVLKEIVLDDLNRIIGTVENLKAIIEEQAEAIVSPTDMYEEEFEKLMYKKQRIQKLRKGAFEQHILGTITADEYTAYREEYAQEEQRIDEKIARIEAKMDAQNEHNILEAPWVDQLLQFKGVKELTRDMVVEMVHNIYVYEDKRIKIVYNFSGELEYLMRQQYEI